MSIDFYQQQVSNMHVLEEIQTLPLTLNKPLYRNYPAMKLGNMYQIDFFSQKLCAMAADILQQDAQHNNWVITAPPYYQLPAAANLLARKIHQLLQQQGITLSLIEPRLSQQQIAISNQEEFKRYHDYSKNTLQQRIEERQRVQQTLHTEALTPRFKDHCVLIINDINVTGTQQHFMQKNLNQFQIKACYWLYIFNVDDTLAKNHPEVEYQLNHSQINDLDSYANLLIDDQTQHTARCISRLFNENINSFRYLVSALSEKKRLQIYQLAQLEGRYNSLLFDEKMYLLTNGITPQSPVVSTIDSTTTEL